MIEYRGTKSIEYRPNSKNPVAFTVARETNTKLRFQIQYVAELRIFFLVRISTTLQ